MCNSNEITSKFEEIDTTINLENSVDVHNHIQESDDVNFDLIKCTRVAVMGTKPEDWETVTKLYENNKKRVIPCFGIHPWFSEKVSDEGWLSELINYLKRYPNAIVGEIGVDKVATDPTTKVLYNFNSQLNIFKTQFQLAALFNRPCSIHVVQSQGVLIDYFTEIKKDLLKEIQDETKVGLSFPKKIMLHSFSGSHETALNVLRIAKFSKKEMSKVSYKVNTELKNIVDQNDIQNELEIPKIYFSVSMLVNGRMSFDKFLKLLRVIPKDALLLESDTGNFKHVDQLMINIAKLVAKAWDLNVQEVIDLCVQNSKKFFNS